MKPYQLIRNAMSFCKSRRLVAAIFIAICPALSFAHPGHRLELGFVNGFFHPLSGLDHFAVIFLVGVIGFYVLKSKFLGPLSFMGGMILGAAVGVYFQVDPLFEAVISFSVLCLGLMSLFNTTLYQHKSILKSLMIGLLAFFGAFHGLAHTTYLTLDQSNVNASLILDMLGLLAGTAILHATGLLVSTYFEPKRELLLKSLGSIACAYGVFLLLTQFNYA
jgi:urease accessory protein